LVINGLNYYAPLSSYKPKQDKINNITVFKLHEKGNPNNKLGVIHINNMFPVTDDQLIEITIDITDKYGRLLQNQYEFILHFQDQIQAQAQQLYDLANKNRNSFIARLSCDFKLLETALNQ
jgi:protein AbiQ